jgi:hypothetical protein
MRSVVIHRGPPPELLHPPELLRPPNMPVPSLAMARQLGLASPAASSADSNSRPCEHQLLAAIKSHPDDMPPTVHDLAGHPDAAHSTVAKNWTICVQPPARAGIAASRSDSALRDHGYEGRSDLV